MRLNVSQRNPFYSADPMEILNPPHIVDRICFRALDPGSRVSQMDLRNDCLKIARRGQKSVLHQNAFQFCIAVPSHGYQSELSSRRDSRTDSPTYPSQEIPPAVRHAIELFDPRHRAQSLSLGHSVPSTKGIAL